jgi:hypothetical protein
VAAISMKYFHGTTQRVGSRVARFFLVKHTKMGNNYQNNNKIYQMAKKRNGNKIFQNIPKYSIARPSKIYPNREIYHLATLVGCANNHKISSLFGPFDWQRASGVSMNVMASA